MILAALAVGAVLSGATAASPAVVVLPFDNLSGSNDAAHDVGALFAKAAERRGWRVVASSEIEPLLEKDRVRYLDSLEEKTRGEIVSATGATAIVSGSVYTYASGRNPIVAVTARMMRVDGSVAWGDVAGLSADDTEKALGFGRGADVAAVAARTIDALTRHFPAPGEEGALVGGRRKPIFRTGPISFRAAELDPSVPHRVCVLPFDSTNVSDAPRAVADVLTIRLASASGFEVVEPAALREAALKANIASFRWIDSDDLARLAPLVGTPLFLHGTIYQYDDPAESRSTTTPQLQIEMTLVDVQNRRVLWTAEHSRKGTDYTGLFMLGAISNALTLTDRVLSEIIATGTRPQSKSATSSAAARAAKKRPEKVGEKR